MRPPIAALLTATLVVLPTVGAASTVPLQLELSDDVRMGQAQLLVGHLRFEGPPLLLEPSFVELRSMDLPPGTLFVCPAQSGERGEIPPLPVVQDRCRGEDRYDDPTLAFGDRTWARFGTNHTLTSAPTATTSWFVEGPTTGSLQWLALTGEHGLQMTPEGDAFVFRPLVGSSEVAVSTDDGQERRYNGSDWLFYFEGPGTIELGSAGIGAGLTAPQEVTLAPAGAEALTPVLEPRRLLDLQDAVVGPDAREPVRNATQVFGDQGRIPHLLDGALVGYLNGTVGETRLDTSKSSTVGVDRLDATVGDDRLEGNASVRYVRASGFSTDAGDPEGVPWILATVLWLLALASVLLLERPDPDRGAGALAVRSLPLVGLLGWDVLFNLAVGTSALALLGDASLGVWLALAGFEVIAFALAWGLLYVPARVVLERLTPERLHPWPSAVAFVLFGLYVLLRPGAVIAAGQLLARL